MFLGTSSLGFNCICYMCFSSLPPPGPLSHLFIISSKISKHFVSHLNSPPTSNVLLTSTHHSQFPQFILHQFPFVSAYQLQVFLVGDNALINRWDVWNNITFVVSDDNLKPLLSPHLSTLFLHLLRNVLEVSADTTHVAQQTRAKHLGRNRGAAAVNIRWWEKPGLHMTWNTCEYITIEKRTGLTTPPCGVPY